MANQSIVSRVEVIAGNIANAFGAKVKAETLGGALAVQMSELFAECDSDALFAEVFGNGVNGKAHVPGLLRDAVELKIAKMSADKKEGIRNMLRVRMSEARKLRRLGGMPQKGEQLQAALKRYQKAPERNARPEGNDKAKFSIPEELTHEQLADALSIWLSAQTPAKANALAADLKDMFKPAPAKKVRAAA